MSSHQDSVSPGSDADDPPRSPATREHVGGATDETALAPVDISQDVDQPALPHRLSRTRYIVLASVAVIGVAGTWIGATVGSRPASSSAALDATTRTRLTAWADKGGAAHVATIRADARSVSSDLLHLNQLATAAACTRMASDITAAEAYAPIPDAQTQSNWSKSLRDMHQAAIDLASATSDVAANGANANNVALMNTASREISTATQN